MKTVDYCVWLKDSNGDYTTSCNNTTIDKNNYIDRYCTCCGKRIVTPILVKTYNDKPREENYHAN